MIRTRTAQAIAVVALVLGVATLLPSAAVAAESTPANPPVVVLVDDPAGTGTWGG
ncbi:hypothetical protein [Streptomyces sp. NPDC058401]|uniref:hypothetical protein n=1 Tax=Streptomyces sp. NPDC058401 TaxID=3346480 RepID=UPI0036488588